MDNDILARNKSIRVPQERCPGLEVVTLSKKEQEEQQQAKNGYWQNELDSLGIEPKRKKSI
jgi:hypothetical protein